METNPETWNYFDGFTRFYLELLPLNDCPIELPFDSLVDEVKFFRTSEPENDETISSISCTYQGDGLFQIGWHGNSQYEHNGHRYEVSYSTNPITNANYPSATVVPGGPFSRLEGSYNFMFAEFTIQVQDDTRYYFAIKDIDWDIPYISKIDDPIGEVSTAGMEPNADAGADLTLTDTDGDGVENLILDGAASSDPDGTIEQYLWDENGVQIAQGQTPSVLFEVGTHAITLLVIDNDGLSVFYDDVMAYCAHKKHFMTSALLHFCRSFFSHT